MASLAQNDAVLLADVARTSAAVAARSSRLQKIELLAGTLRLASPEEAPVAVAFLSGELPNGTIGVGWASLRDLPPPAPPPPTLRLLDAHELLERLRLTTGPGSQADRHGLLTELFARATEEERRFLRGLLLGELRQGALEGVVAEAIARAADVGASEVRRAAMLAGDLKAVAAAAMAEGGEGLRRFRLTVLQPVKPMLAQTAGDVEAAMARIRPASVEWKLDGARIQVHRDRSEVRAFTRNLADVTDRVPEVVEAVLRLPLQTAILDAEAIALGPDERPFPFQVTMSRLGTRREAERRRAGVALVPFFFDCLHLDGEDLIDLPLRDRYERFAPRLPEELRIPRSEVSSEEGARPILEAALAHGHEGVMVKALDSPYEAGRRGAAWLKVKRAHTLDLVVLAAEWGHGRRRGWLSNLHLGARDGGTGGFVMLGKTFKGLTDEVLRWQTERLLDLELSRDEYTVHVRPELVVEVAFDGVQTSTRYPGGVALRFARVKGYRPDKRPEDADTIDIVRAIHAGAAPGG